MTIQDGFLWGTGFLAALLAFAAAIALIALVVAFVSYSRKHLRKEKTGKDEVPMVKP